MTWKMWPTRSFFAEYRSKAGMGKRQTATDGQTTQFDVLLGGAKVGHQCHGAFQKARDFATIGENIGKARREDCPN